MAMSLLCLCDARFSAFLKFYLPAFSEKRGERPDDRPRRLCSSSCFGKGAGSTCREGNAQTASCFDISLGRLPKAICNVKRSSMRFSCCGDLSALLQNTSCFLYNTNTYNSFAVFLIIASAINLIKGISFCNS